MIRMQWLKQNCVAVREERCARIQGAQPLSVTSGPQLNSPGDTRWLKNEKNGRGGGEGAELPSEQDEANLGP